MTSETYGPLWQLRQLRRGKVHGGYRWAAIMQDCELICETCVETEYKAIFKETWRNSGKRRETWPDQQWLCVGITNSEEHEADYDETCAHCGKIIFEAMEA